MAYERLKARKSSSGYSTHLNKGIKNSPIPQEAPVLKFPRYKDIPSLPGKLKSDDEQVREWADWSLRSHTVDEIRDRLSKKDIDKTCVSYICKSSVLPDSFIDEFVMLSTGIVFQKAYSPFRNIASRILYQLDTEGDPSTRRALNVVTELFCLDIMPVGNETNKKKKELKNIIRNRDESDPKEVKEKVKDVLDRLWKEDIYPSYREDTIKNAEFFERKSSGVEKSRVDWFYIMQYQSISLKTYYKYQRIIDQSVKGMKAGDLYFRNGKINYPFIDSLNAPEN